MCGLRFVCNCRIRRNGHTHHTSRVDCAGIADHHTARIKHLCRLIRVREAGQTHRIAIHNEIHAAETRQYIRIRWLMGSVYRHTTYRNVWIQGRSGILAHPCGRVRLLLDRWVITSVTGREQCSGIHVAVFGVQLVGIDFGRIIEL